MTPKKRKRVVTPDETRPTKKLSHANANNLQTFQAAINKAVPITLDRTNIFKWLQDDDKPSKTYGCPYTVKKLAINGFAPISYAARKAPNKGRATGKSSRLAQLLLIQPTGINRRRGSGTISND